MHLVNEEDVTGERHGFVRCKNLVRDGHIVGNNTLRCLSSRLALEDGDAWTEDLFILVDVICGHGAVCDLIALNNCLEISCVGVANNGAKVAGQLRLFNLAFAVAF